MSDKDVIVGLGSHAAYYADDLVSAFAKYGIKADEQDEFLGQAYVESMQFTRTIENLNYSAAGLQNTFHKYFPDEATAERYAHNPKAIGSRVYANRMGNGDEGTGDGYKYCGKGLIQITGHDNHLAYSKWRYGDDRILQNPSMMTTAPDAAWSAVWFWIANGVGRYVPNTQQISALINTGNANTPANRINGLNDRLAAVARVKGIRAKVNGNS